MMLHTCIDLVLCSSAKAFITRNASFVLEATAASKCICMGDEGALMMLSFHLSDAVCACQTCGTSQCCSVQTKLVLLGHTLPSHELKSFEDTFISDTWQS